MEALPLRQDADVPLLLTGRSPEETLVLIRVSVRAAHRDVLLITVELAHTLDVGSVLAAASSEATRPGVTHSQVALLLRQIWAVGGLPGAAFCTSAAGERAP